MIDYKFLGSRIRAVRLEKKITQEKLAEAAGVGVTHISHIETGKTKLSVQCLLDIANALHGGKSSSASFESLALRTCCRL